MFKSGIYQFRQLLTVLFFISLCGVTDGEVVEKNGYSLNISADRTDALYKKGEPVSFVITATKNGSPETNAAVKYTISKDGVPLSPERKGQITLENGRAVLSATLDEPGFLQCAVNYQSESAVAINAKAAAAIDPLEIQPSMPAPDDFDAFWSEQKALLAAVPLNIRLTPVATVVKGVEVFDVQADSINGPMSGYLARPVNAAPKSLPAIVTTHGAGVYSSRSGTAAKWAAEGFVALDFNVHGLTNGAPADFYIKLRNGELQFYNVSGRESRDTVYFRHVFLRLLRAIDTVAAQPEWDGKEMIIFGRSQGGGQALVAGALDSRVTFVSAEIPALCDHTGIMVGRINGWPKFIPAALKTPDPKVVEAVRYYDCVNFASRIKAPVSMTVGFIDVTCPPTGVYAVYNQIQGKKTIWNHIDTGHAGRADYETRMHDEVLDYIQSKKAQTLKL